MSMARFPDRPLERRNAIVTASGRGIGKTIVQRQGDVACTALFFWTEDSVFSTGTAFPVGEDFSWR